MKTISWAARLIAGLFTTVASLPPLRGRKFVRLPEQLRLRENSGSG